MTTETATAFKLPDLDTVYHCEGLGAMTLGQMLDGVDPDLIPQSPPTRPCTRTCCGPSGRGRAWRR